MRDPFRAVGAPLAELVIGAGDVLALLWKTLRRVVHPSHPGRELRAMVIQMYEHGVKAIPVVILVAIFTGMIVSLQTGIEIKTFGQEDMIGLIVSASMFREMGPFITAIILTATAGAACAAEIGTMKVSEELDALEMMSIDPVRYLVVPRVLALGLMCFALTILTDVFGTAGGAVIARNELGVSYDVYFRGAKEAVEGEYVLGLLSKDIYSGLVKAFLFGIVVGIVGCSQGLRATGGALGVGRAVRRAVVSSILFILILGYFVTWAFYGA